MGPSGLAWLGPQQAWLGLRCSRLGLAWLGLAWLEAQQIWLGAQHTWLGLAWLGVAWLGFAQKFSTQQKFLRATRETLVHNEFCSVLLTPS